MAGVSSKTPAFFFNTTMSDTVTPDTPIARIAAPALDAILGKPFKVLDDGFVRAVDYMGSDAAIVQAARVSYGDGTKKGSDDEHLVRYLMRHPGEVLSKTQLYEHVYDYDAEHDSNVIEVYVRRLRLLIGTQHIETHRGQGYVFLP